MKYNPGRHNRRSIRLKNYDYSQSGAYFITICTNKRECLFGKIVNGEMILNEYGEIVKNCWLEIPQHYPNVELDEFIIMPNHIHGIIVIIKNDVSENIVGVQNVGAKNDTNVGVQNIEPLQKRNEYQKIIPESICSIIRGFKIGVTKWFRQNTNIFTVWQRNYYEHIIRNEIELYRIRKYIIHNPLNWESNNNYQEKNKML